MRELDKALAPALAQRRREGLYRRRRIVEGPAGARVRIDGRELLNFCSNDYLGLAAHPRLIGATVAATREWGVGSGAAHLITGHSRAHHELEAALADFTGRPRALLFSTGYMANIGIAQALVGRGDLVCEDRLNHASLLDGGLLSGARLRRYAHADALALSECLKSDAGNRLVMTDGVFSMDGDVAPLHALCAVAREHDAWLMVDDAHGLGVLGPDGGGSVAEAGLGIDEVPVLMGTLGKAFGCFGAFVAGSEVLIETLIQLARTYVYTTASPPAVAAAGLEALKLVRQEAWRREKLAELTAAFRDGCKEAGVELMPSHSPIQPVVVGDSREAVRHSELLADAGYLLQAIRPPTVPRHTARLRVTLSAAHELDQVRGLVAAIAKTREAGKA
jgi:8-amino-7-oxononanoate synthase